MMNIRVVYILLLFSLLMAGCSAKPSAPGERYFFPPEPAEPKIEYLQSYFSDHDLESGQVDLFEKYVLGKMRPRAIFTTPVDVASDGKGKVYVSDSGARDVFILDLPDYSYSRLSAKEAFAGGGFGVPIKVALDDEKRLYVVDVLMKRVQVFDPDGRLLVNLSDDSLVRPTAVAADSARGLVYVVDTAEHRVAIFADDGTLRGFIGERGARAGEFNFPTDVDIDDNGHIYVLDSLNARVQVFDENGKFLRMFGERGTADGSFSVPKGITVSPEGHVYVTDAISHKFVVFSREGDLLLRVGGKSIASRGVSPGGFYLPRGIDYDSRGGLWVVDSLNRMVHRFQYLTPDYLASHPLN